MSGIVSARLRISIRPSPCNRPRFREMSSRTVPSRAASSSLFSSNSMSTRFPSRRPWSFARWSRCAMSRPRTVENDNFSTSPSKCLSLCPNTRMTLIATFGYCMQILRKCSAGSSSTIVETTALAVEEWRPSSNTGNSAREFPARSIAINCSRPLAADLNTLTSPASTINSSWHVPLPKISFH
jgi:hypothetical protein